MSRISVVMQGAVSWAMSPIDGLPITFSAVRRIRALMPGAEIILSTWKGQETKTIDADLVLLNDDPGDQTLRGMVPNNVNRQIVSTRNGLKASSGDRALKIRTDALVTGTNFIDAFEGAGEAPHDFLVFERRVVSNNLSSRNPRASGGTPLPFHPADHAHFGLTSDLLKLWDIPLQTDNDAYYFARRRRPDHYRDGETSRLTPEQHVCTSFLAKFMNVDLPEYTTLDPEIIDTSDRVLQSNFIFLRDADFSMHLNKYHTRAQANFEWMRYPANDRGRLRQKVKRLLKL